MADDTYQTNVYHEQGGGAEIIKSGGIIRGHSGGMISMESGYAFTLASQAMLAKDITRVVHSRNDPLTITPVAGSTVYTPNYLDSNIRMVTLIGSATVATGSFILGSCSAGNELFLRVVGDLTGTFTNNATDVTISISGCTLLGSVGAALTSMTMYTSAAKDALVHFIAPIDDVWAIMSTNGGSIAEH